MLGSLRPVSDRQVQVAPEHYDFERYDDPERWMSYWHQLRAVLSVRPKSVLEIGPGSGVFRNYLRAKGVDVKTLDIDASRDVDCARYNLWHGAPCSTGAVCGRLRACHV